MSAVLRILVCYLLAGGLFFLAWTCLKGFKAAVYSIQVGAVFNAWAARPDKPPSDGEMKRVERALREASVLDPQSPVIHEHLSQLYVWQATRDGVDSDVVAALGAKSLAEARRVVSLRPAWPMAWARLLSLKAGFDLPDAEFSRSLERATTLGPWDLPTSKVVAAAVLPIWEEVSPEDRQIAANAAVRGLRQDSKQMLPIVRESGRLVEVCAAMAGQPELHQRVCADVIE
ncbi:hypothetical protein [Methylococcus geothermalis]|uniref:Uncharacterized protein n=1 Tax=Methylococcus geothermalis TaxID=2681310 RepID=A0A858Q9S5_9GAMM|nr:hypothetical protein [Methylococcus geothermalis]QJD30648.1 hypothetical protein GNH96_12110 [Methylococcus geothermalis]